MSAVQWPGAVLRKGEQWESSDKLYRLIFQDDCNLVLYQTEAGRPAICVWTTSTQNKVADRVVLQSDGNFVMYDGDHALWSSGSGGHEGQRVWLVLHDDGNLRVYSNNIPIWGTETYNVRRFRKIEFFNDAETECDCYPLVLDATGKRKIWSGRWNVGLYWTVRKGNTKPVDFGEDFNEDGRRLEKLLEEDNRCVKLGLEVVFGNDIWWDHGTFVFDRNCDTVYRIEKYGSLRNGDQFGDNGASVRSMNSAGQYEYTPFDRADEARYMARSKITW